MRRIIILLIAFILSSNTIFAEDKVTEKQDALNKKYLILLTENIVSTVDMLSTFNETSHYIGESVENGDQYKSFLLEMTLECSNLIEKIRDAEDMQKLEREMQIRALIVTLKPDIEYKSVKISKSENTKNKVYLADVTENLNGQIKTLLNGIMKEEKDIIESQSLTLNYLRLHSFHFLFSLLLDFIEPGLNLSKTNRDYLVWVTKSMDESLQQSKK